jgi:hypothetical protein
MRSFMTANSNLSTISTSSSGIARLSIADTAGDKDQEDVKLDFLGGPVKMPGESTSEWIKRRAKFRKSQMKKLLGSSDGDSGKQPPVQGECAAAPSLHSPSTRSCGGLPAAMPAGAHSEVALKPSQQPIQQQQQQRQQGMGSGVGKPQRELCGVCQKPHFVIAQHPSGVVGGVESYLKGGGVPHMIQVPGRGWLCEWCRYYHCSRCNELHLDENSTEAGLWGKEKACTPKCERRKGPGREQLRTGALERARALERVHCLTCRDQMVMDRVPFQPQPQPSSRRKTAIHMMTTVVGITITTVASAVAGGS